MHKNRCAWVTDDLIYKEYHDYEWGSGENLQDDRYLFEMLSLEGAQAGLSWLTILKRRENYRSAFDQFNPEAISHYDQTKINQLVDNKGIIRNKRKIESVVKNAQAFLDIQQEHGSFYAFLQTILGTEPIINHWSSEAEVPAATKESQQLSKTLKARSFSFVGPIICYSFMQAVGLVNDHTKDCFLYRG